MDAGDGHYYAVFFEDSLGRWLISVAGDHLFPLTFMSHTEAADMAEALERAHERRQSQKAR